MKGKKRETVACFVVFLCICVDTCINKHFSFKIYLLNPLTLSNISGSAPVELLDDRADAVQSCRNNELSEQRSDPIKVNDSWQTIYQGKMLSLTLDNMTKKGILFYKNVNGEYIYVFIFAIFHIREEIRVSWVNMLYFIFPQCIGYFCFCLL